MTDTRPTRTVVFVCAHGAAKSVIAAAYLDRLARERGLNVSARAAGTDPDPEVAPAAARGLLEDGIDVRGLRPRRVTRDELAGAWRIVSFGCELTDLAPPGRAIERWDDVPPVSTDFRAARETIAARVGRLLDQCTEDTRS